MIKPVNGHLLIEPLKQETFMAKEGGVYEEIGVVLDFQEPLADNKGIYINTLGKLKKGYKVYFDSWLAAKYPTGKGQDFLWLVKWDDVRAVEPNDEIPE